MKFAIEFDPTKGTEEPERIIELLHDLQTYIDQDRVETHDDAAILACDVLIRWLS